METYTEGTRTPWAAATDLGKVGEKGEGGLVPKRHVDQAVVSQRAQACNRRALLATAKRSGRDEQPRILAPVGTRLPLAASLIPESLPLGWEVAITGGDTKEEPVVLLKRLRILERRDFAVLGRGMHFGQDLLGESLRDLVDVGRTASFLDALGLSLGEGLDVAPGGVLESIASVEEHIAWSNGPLEGH